MPDEAAQVQCKSCGFANPASTRFCKDCGAPLVLPDAVNPDKGAEPSPHGQASTQSKQERPKPQPIRKSVSAGGIISGIFRLIFALINIAILGALVALVVVAITPPESLPTPAPAMMEPVASDWRARMNAAVAGTDSATLEVPWPALNSYLDLRFPPAHLSEFLGKPVRFERVMVAPSKSGIELIMERSLAGKSVYFCLDYELITRSRGVEPKLASARMGSLEIPTALAGPIEKLFEPVAAGLSTELDTLRNLRNVTTAPPAAVLNFQPR